MLRDRLAVGLLILLVAFGMAAQAADVRCVQQDHCCCESAGMHGDCCRVATILPALLAFPPPPTPFLAPSQPVQVVLADWTCEGSSPRRERFCRQAGGLRGPPSAS